MNWGWFFIAAGFVVWLLVWLFAIALCSANSPERRPLRRNPNVHLVRNDEKKSA